MIIFLIIQILYVIINQIEIIENLKNDSMFKYKSSNIYYFKIYYCEKVYCISIGDFSDFVYKKKIRDTSCYYIYNLLNKEY